MTPDPRLDAVQRKIAAQDTALNDREEKRCAHLD
jgi:hypothetical protein